MCAVPLCLGSLSLVCVETVIVCCGHGVLMCSQCYLAAVLLTLHRQNANLRWSICGGQFAVVVLLLVCEAAV